MNVNWTSYDSVSHVFKKAMEDKQEEKAEEEKKEGEEGEKKEEEEKKEGEEGEKKEGEQEKKEGEEENKEGDEKKEEGQKKEEEEEKEEDKVPQVNDSMHSHIRKELVVGGVVDITLIDFLPGPKKTAEWQLKKKFSEEEAVVKQFFPPLDTNGQMNWQNLTEIKVQYALPSTVFIHQDDDKQVAYWDGEKWNSHTIEDVKLELHNNQKLLSFSTKRLAPFAYV